MNIGNVMTRGVKACRPDDHVNAAARIMWEHDCGCVPVVDADSRVIGVLTDRDICMAAYTQGKNLSAIPVSAAMSKEVIGCAASDSLATAEGKMRVHQVHRLPVTDDAGRLIGLVSLNDLFLAAARAPHAKGKEFAALSETMVAICAHRPHEQHAAAA